MKFRRSLVAWGVVALFVSACSVATSGGSSTGKRVNRNVITAEEIAAASQADAYELVQSLRPAWLRMRGQSSISRPEAVMAYRDGMQIGTAAALRQIPRHGITRIQRFDGMVATQRWGTGHGNGAIEVITGTP